MDGMLDSRELQRAGDRVPPARASRQSAGSLFEQRGFPRAVFDAIPNPLLVVDAEMQVRLVNDHMVRQLAFGLGDVVQTATGQILRCYAPLGHADGRCGQLDVCAGCKLRRSAEDALAGLPVQRRECELDLVAGGRTRRFKVLVSATRFDHQGTDLAVVVLEEVTELETRQRARNHEESFAGMVGSSPRMAEIFDVIRDVASFDVPVLIQGESGTGKELVARAIHSQGTRAREPFVAVNCGAIPDGLLESELFGHVKGAFTGATRTRKGRFELADRGTILLDEIADIDPAMQVKLLRVLQEGTFEPVGGETTVRVNVRVVSATNKDIAAEVAAGRFREDLYYRLCVVPITVPPLRERLVDLPVIAEHLLATQGVASSARRQTVSDSALAVLLRHHWPGNVRELDSALRYAAIKCKNGQILPQHLPPELRLQAGLGESRSLRRARLSEAVVAEALREAGGNRSAAARTLGVGRATLYRFLGGCPETEADGAPGARSDGRPGSSERAIAQPAPDTLEA